LNSRAVLGSVCSDLGRAVLGVIVTCSILVGSEVNSSDDGGDGDVVGCGEELT